MSDKEIENIAKPVVDEKEQISSDDFHLLELSEMNCKLAKLESEKSIMQQQITELSYKYLVAQLYIKYQLSPQDALTNNGEIVRNGKKNGL